MVQMRTLETLEDPGYAGLLEGIVDQSFCGTAPSDHHYSASDP
jgi:hypothetical protein